MTVTVVREGPSHVALVFNEPPWRSSKMTPAEAEALAVILTSREQAATLAHDLRQCAIQARWGPVESVRYRPADMPERVAPPGEAGVMAYSAGEQELHQDIDLDGYGDIRVVDP